MRTLTFLAMDLGEIQRAIERPGHEVENAEFILAQLKEAQMDFEEAIMRIKYRQQHIKNFLINFNTNEDAD